MKEKTLKAKIMRINNISSKILSEDTVNYNKLADLKETCFEVFDAIACMFDDMRIKLQ